MEQNISTNFKLLEKLIVLIISVFSKNAAENKKVIKILKWIFCTLYFILITLLTAYFRINTHATYSSCMSKALFMTIPLFILLFAVFKFLAFIKKIIKKTK